jgi:transcription initiation factor IIF auxiliary subunit
MIVMKRFFIILSLLLVAVTLGAQGIRLNNTAAAAKSKGYYNWKVFLDADVRSLASVDRVEYLLHPTFPNPQVTVQSNRTNPTFSYGATGWGEFEIKARVVFRDRNKKPLLLNYWLKLR